jgi:hypothetical protein
MQNHPTAGTPYCRKASEKYYQAIVSNNVVAEQNALGMVKTYLSKGQSAANHVNNKKQTN